MQSRSKRKRDVRDASGTLGLVTDIETAQHLLNKSKNGVYDLIKSGELQGYREGRARRIVVASIHQYIARKVAEAKSFTRGRYPGQAETHA
jgi:excisionase family DNA binding protein